LGCSRQPVDVFPFVRSIWYEVVPPSTDSRDPLTHAGMAPILHFDRGLTYSYTQQRNGFVSGGSLRSHGKIPGAGLWKEMMVFVRLKVAPTERDGKTFSVDDTPRDVWS